jgi:hypothetical protein
MLRQRACVGNPHLGGGSRARRGARGLSIASCASFSASSSTRRMSTAACPASASGSGDQAVGVFIPEHSPAATGAIKTMESKMRMFKVLIVVVVAVVFGSPVRALEIGDSVRFPTDLSFGCNLIEDARQATAHVERYGSSKESSDRFMKGIYDWGLRRPLPYVHPKRYCGTLKAADEVFDHDAFVYEYRVLNKSDDGYVCLTGPRVGLRKGNAIEWGRTFAGEEDGLCLWVNLQVWNVQITSNPK